ATEYRGQQVHCEALHPARCTFSIRACTKVTTGGPRLYCGADSSPAPKCANFRHLPCNFYGASTSHLVQRHGVAPEFNLRMKADKSRLRIAFSYFGWQQD